MKPNPSRRPLFAAALLAALAFFPAKAAALESIFAVAYSSLPASLETTLTTPTTAVSIFLRSVGAQLSSIQMIMLGDVPATQAKGEIWEDTNDNGVLDTGVDVRVTTAQFTGAPPAPANISFFFGPGGWSISGAGRRFFVRISYTGFPGGRSFRLAMDQPYHFQLTGGAPPFDYGGFFPYFTPDGNVAHTVHSNPAQAGAQYPTPRVSPAVGGGLDTGVRVDQGQLLTINAQVGGPGSWDSGALAGVVGPGGSGSNGGLAGFNQGALMARVGGGSWFKVGASTTLAAPNNGIVYLGMNDDVYTDNTGFQLVLTSVTPAALPKVWKGGTPGFETLASIAANWTGGVPHHRESVVLDTCAYSLDWDLPGVELAGLTISTAFNHEFRVQPGFGGFETMLRVSSHVLIAGGTFYLQRQDLEVRGRLTVTGRGILDFGFSNAGSTSGSPNVRVLEGVVISSGGMLRSSIGGIMEPLDNQRGLDFSVYRATISIGASTGVVTQFNFSEVKSALIGPGLRLGRFDDVFFQNQTSNLTSNWMKVRGEGGDPAVYVFRRWDLQAAGGLQALDATEANGVEYHFIAAGGNKRGSAWDTDPADVLKWFPDGGGTFGQINGQVTCAGPDCLGPAQSDPNWYVIASTSPDGYRLTTTYKSGNFTPSPTGSGNYNINSLPAPNTYYVFAVENQSDGDGLLPTNKKARGGFGHPGFYRSEPVFVDDGTTVNSIDITGISWSHVSGAVSNPTSQVGPIRVEAWRDAPYAAASTMTASYSAGINSGFGFDTYNSPTLLAYIDVNGNKSYDSAFEASDTVVVSVSTGVTQNNVSLTLSGGAPAPGGTVTLATDTAHAGAVAREDFTPLVRLHLTAGGSDAGLGGVKMKYTGGVPIAGSVTFEAYEDVDDDGVYDIPIAANNYQGDRWLGTGSLMPNVSTAVVQFMEQLVLPLGQTRHVLAGVRLAGATADVSSVSMRIEAATDFGLTAGDMANQPSYYPIIVPSAELRLKVRADNYAYASGYNGAFGGICVGTNGGCVGSRVFQGQSLTSFSGIGSWTTGSGAPTVPVSGQAATEGQSTVVPGARRGELIGNVRNCDASCYSSGWFRVGGATLPLAIPMTGDLHLAINDYENAYADNDGSIYFKFAVGGSTLGTLSGTVHYSTPTAGYLTITARRYSSPVRSSTVTVNAANPHFPYSFGELNPGLYDLSVTHSVNSDFGVSAQESVGQGESVLLDADMFLGNATISGNISYSGNQQTGPFRIFATTMTDLRDEVFPYAQTSVASPGAYSLTPLPAPATYFIVAFRDSNYNTEPDGPEPFGYYGAPGGSLGDLVAYATAVWVNAGDSLGGRNLTLEDQGAIEGNAALPASPAGSLVVEAGIGVFGAPGFVKIGRSRTQVPPAMAPGTVMYFQMGLLKPATNYSLFAFLDSNDNGVIDAGEPTTQTAADIQVLQGSRARRDLALNAAQAPSAPGLFGAQPVPGGVFFQWNLVPGATGYQLRSSTGAYLTLLAPATVYLHALTANTSSPINAIKAQGPNGDSPVKPLGVTVWTDAAVPNSLAAGGPTATSVGLTWSANGNPAGTVYELTRATSAAGGGPGVLFLGAALSHADKSLAQGQPYFYRVRAFNNAGLATASDGPVAVTAAGSGVGLGGTVTYQGAQPGALVVEAHSNASFTALVSSVSLPAMAKQPWYLPVGAGAHFVRGWKDVLGTGVRAPYADTSLSQNPTAPVFSVDFSVSVDTVVPGPPAGLLATPGVRKVDLAWAAPTKNGNGAPLTDLRGFIVRVSTGGAGLQSFSTTVTTFTFHLPPTSSTNVALVRAQVLAQDFGGNISSPTAFVDATPSQGGSISGSLAVFAPAANAQFRVRLATASAPSAAPVAETTLSTYQFSGLADGVYYLRGYRDDNGNGREDPRVEPAGSFGGLVSPFPLRVVNGNSVTGANATVCARTLITVGQPAVFTLTGADCPALDKGPGFTTKLYALSAGDGLPGSIGVGSRVSVSLKAAFDTEIIVLGPDGSIVARDNTPGGAGLSFTASSTGTYLFEPTVFSQGSGAMTLTARVDGGFAGTIAGVASYSGAQTGKVHVQLFTSTATDASAVVTSTYAAPGSFALGGLRDGVYYLRAFRDDNANGVRDAYEAAGTFGTAASSITILGGAASPAGPHPVVLADAAVGTLSGTVIYRGSQGGSIRIQAGFPRCTNCGDMDIPAITKSTGPSGSFTLDFLAPATNYIVRAFVDQNANGRPDSLEPLISSMNVTVVANATRTLGLLLDDPGTTGAFGSAVIGATVSYSGSITGPLFVGISRDMGFNRIDYLVQLPDTGYFSRAGVQGDSSYYMAAFIDANGNNTPDPDEPQGVGKPAGYGAEPTFDSPPAIPIVGLYGSTDAIITLRDAPSGEVKGAITYTGSAPGVNYVVSLRRPFVFSRRPDLVIPKSAGAVNFTVGQLEAADDYNLSVFLDSNNNGRFDQGEPGAGRQSLAVSSGAGSFPLYGQDVDLFDGSQGGAGNAAGEIDLEASYLGIQGGPVFFRLFDNEQRTGVPVAVVQVNGPAGPGFFDTTKQGLEPGTYWGDAFRDPSGAGVYVPALHAFGRLNKGEAITLQQYGGRRHAHAEVVDPGQGGSVNAFTGSFAAASGVRFDGGATDLSAMVVIDSFTASAPQPVVMGLSAQNDGEGLMFVRYSSAGVMVSSRAFGGGNGGENVNEFVLGSAGLLYTGGRLTSGTESTSSFASTGTVKTYDSSFTLQSEVKLEGAEKLRVIARSTTTGALYVAGPRDGNGNQLIVLKLNPADMVATATGTFNFPALCGNGGCGLEASAIAVAPDGSAVWVYASNQSQNDGRGLHFLMKFNPATLALINSRDVTSLNLPDHEGVTLAPAQDGGVYAAGVPEGETSAMTFKYDSSLSPAGSAVFGPIVTRFNGGMGHVRVDYDGDGSVYQTWESTGRAGDFSVLRYDASLNLLHRVDIDGGTGVLEDFPFSLGVYNSSIVYVTGAINNGRNLDWATFRINMNATASLSAPGTAVDITTSTANNYVFGALFYDGAQATSGTVRASLTPVGSAIPIRLSTHAFGAAPTYLFNNVPFGSYGVRAFIDKDGDLLAGPSEPVTIPPMVSYFQGSSLTVPTADLCDRTEVVLSTTIAATLTAADCRAWDRGAPRQKLYAFQGVRGQPITAEMTGLGFYDTYLRLYDPEGQIAAEDDDSAGSANARIANYVLPRTGLYTLAASAWPGAAGAYSLSIRGSAGSLGAIAGDVQYSGLQGGAVRVGAYRSPAFSTSTLAAFQTLLSTRVYSFAGLPTGTTYYLGAFIDVNANGNPDAGEDAGVFGVLGVPDALFLQQGQDLSGVTIAIAPSTASLASASYVTGITSYTGTQQGRVILEFWSNAQFTGRPVATRVVNSGVGSYDAAVPGGQSYYLRAFLDSTPNFVPDPSEPRGVYVRPGQTGAEPIWAPTGQTLLGVDVGLQEPGLTSGGGVAGQGTAVLSSTYVVSGQQFSITVTYTAGAAGMTAGGKIGLTAPPGFPFPFTSGTSSVTYKSGSAGTTVAVNGPSAVLTLGTPVAPSGVVKFDWASVYAPCQVGAATFTITSVSNGAGGLPAPLLGGSPSLAVVPGAAQFIQLAVPYFAVKQGELSEVNYLQSRDSCGSQAPVTVPETVDVRGSRYDPAAGRFVVDSEIGVSTGAGFSTFSVTTVDFAVGQSSRPFYVVSASTGFKNLEVHFDLAFDATFYFGVQSVPANALASVSIATFATGTGLSSATIGLTALGVPNQVFVNFTLGDPQQSWRVLFSSIPFKAGEPPQPLWERWGYGQPNPGEIAWDGRSNPWINGGARVPNGFYYGRVEIGGGGVKDDTMRVNVSLPQFGGRVYDPGITPNPPLPGVQLRVYGPSGYFTSATGADGSYGLPGLGAGAYRLNLDLPDYVNAAVDVTLDATGKATSFAALSNGVAVSSNSAGGLDVFLSRAPRLTVVPSLDPAVLAQAADLWGSLQVRPSTGSAQNTIYGPMRLKGGGTIFDDGGQWDPSTQQFVARTVLAFNVPVGTYTVLGELPGFSRSSGTVYVGADGAQLDLTPFAQKATVTGQVFITPNPNGAFVSVVGIPLSTGSAGGFASANLAAGTTWALYTMGGLDAGAYILRANTQGLSAVSSGPITVPANGALAGVDFPVFGAGAALTGTITVAGGPANGTPIFVNAWSPGSFNFGSTVVYTNGGTASYALNGLDSGSVYQLYANIQAGGEYDVAGGFPIQTTPPAVVSFTMAQASGVVNGTIYLPAGATDFFNVELYGRVLAAAQSRRVGETFVEISTALPNFTCQGGGALVGGSCPAGVTTATFKVNGLDTQTLELSFLHRTTGQSAKQIVSVVNGSTATLVADLSGGTHQIEGSLVNQVSNALFNTNPKIVANAPFIAPQGYPLGLSSTTARVVAIKQDLSSYGAALSTTFNPLTSRVGFVVETGTFTIPNTPNGVYFVRTADLRSCATCEVLVPSVGRIVTVSGASVSSVTLTVSDGYSVSGRISLADSVQDARIFDVTVVNRRQEVVRSTTVYLGDLNLGVVANGVDYAFANLPAGEFYTLQVRGRLFPIKYVGRPIKFPDPSLSPNGLQSNLTAQDVSLKRAAYVIGRLRDASTGELIGASNATLLASNFGITATASPWIEGGYVVAQASIAGRPIEGDGYFRVGPLLPDQSYDLRLAQTSWDAAFLGQGSQNYAPATLSGLKPTPGEVRDVGVVSLGQGTSLTGVVRSTATGSQLGNIKVVARPSFGDSGLVVQTFTNQQGRYTLWVSTLVSNQFNVTAAPRDGNRASDGLYYGQVLLRNVNLQTQTSADFLLTPLASAVTGQVVVADAAAGGALSYPFGDKRGFPAAAVNLQPAGVVPTNPLGDIETTTDERGFFTVPGLSTGIYGLHATSLGYGTFNATVAVTGAGFRIFVGSNTPSNDLPGSVITLARGASITGRILKSDGTTPSSLEVSGVAAANFALNEFVVGGVEIDPITKTVNSYAISGFKTGISYDIVLLAGRDGRDVSFPPEGVGVSFAASESTTTKSLTLTFKPPRMDCLASAKALDAARSQFRVDVECLKPLRQETAADEDLTQILTVSAFNAAGGALTAPNGAGVMSARTLSSDRRRMTASYATAVSETRFAVRVRAAAAEIDPATGASFTVDRVFDFFTGLDSHSDARVTNINGGSVELAPSANDELLGLSERSRIDLPAGAFAEGPDTLAENLAVANPTITVNVSMTKGTDQQLARALSIAQRGYAPAALELADNPSSLPAETWAAMRAYRTMASTTTVGGANPLSSFYSIFLPAGIRHQLKERADLTLSYTTVASTSTRDDQIQVWFYNAVLGRFVLENTNRRLDTVNKTVTVSVDHFSTFVVLDSTPVLTIPVTFGGSDIAVANFPNPADCIVHSNIAINSFLFGAGGVHAPFLGTMLRASVPPGAASLLKYNIYTVTGEKVRTIQQAEQPGGATYYTPWDCRNDAGRTVASGVYIGEVSHGGKRKFFKIAIIKGSGL